MKLMADVVPNADFEARLQAKGYRPVGWMDIIDECDFTDRKTGKKVKLNGDRLAKMATNRNQLVAERESVAHFCLGHTKDDAPEWEQPPVVALSTRWRVGAYRNGKRNLESYVWEYPKHHGVTEKYPQRSAELYLDPDDINPIALLSSTTPRRDLSFRLSRPDGSVVEWIDPEETTSGSIVRFSRAEGRQPILFALKQGESGGSCRECGKKLKTQDNPVLGTSEAELGHCARCIAKQLQAAIDGDHKQGNDEYNWNNDDDGHWPEGRPTRNSMPQDMKPAVKCDESTATPIQSPDAQNPADAQAAAVGESDTIKGMQAQLSQIMSMLQGWKPALDVLTQELQAEQSGAGAEGGMPPGGAPPGGGMGPDGAPMDQGPAGGSPTAGPGGPPPEAAEGGNKDEEPEGKKAEPDEDKDSPTRNSAGSAAGYGNTFMPNYDRPERNQRLGYGYDPEAAIRLQRLEGDYKSVLQANETLRKETAALRLQRLEDETNAELDRLDREGVTIDREYDFGRLVRLSREDRAKEIAQMVRLRAKKEAPLPNEGKAVIGAEEIGSPVAVKFSRDGMGSDPKLADKLPDDYESLVSMAGEARHQGRNPRHMPIPAQANGTAVAVR